MKFLVDAQLPHRLKEFLQIRGHDVIHVNDMPNRESTTDNEIRVLANLQERIVITKDTDFFDSYILHYSPKKLLWVTTGNIKNVELLSLFEKNFDQIIELFDTFSLVELNNDDLIGHE